jgi:signal transduction histidine kinase
VNTPGGASDVSALERALAKPAMSSRATRAGRPATRPPASDSEADEFLSSLAGPNGLDLVVEIAHDLRSPLTSILFLAEALHQGQSGPVTEAQRRSLALIYSAALSLCTVASDVLELARGGRRLVDREPEPFAVAEVLTSVRNMILPLALEKRLELHLVHAIPERRLGHPHALSRVLLNLATNAIKFTETGCVEIAARAVDARHLAFSVSDTGKGIAPEVLRNLFQPFRRAGIETRYHFSSSGVGLAICRKLVRAMGGELEVATCPDRGSCFSFHLALPPAPERSA